MTLDIGFVGATGHTHYVLDGLRELRDVDVVGTSPGSDGESVDELAERVGERFPGATRYDRAADLLATAPDVVVVACQFGDLADWSRAALDRDCHVYTDKPVATTLADLERVREAHAASAGDLAAMFTRRYDPAVRTARERVADGAVGEVRLIDCRKSYVLGERPPFYRSRDTYGGTIPWVGIHALDWVHWFDDRPVRSVRARHSARANRGHGDLEATGVVDLELADEVLASVSIDYLRPDTAPTHGDDRIRAVGTDGVVEVRDGSAFLIDDAAEGRRELPTLSPPNPFVDFVRGVRGESDPAVTAADSFRATETSLRAREAADADEIVRFD